MSFGRPGVGDSERMVLIWLLRWPAELNRVRITRPQLADLLIKTCEPLERSQSVALLVLEPSEQSRWCALGSRDCSSFP